MNRPNLNDRADEETSKEADNGPELDQDIPDYIKNSPKKLEGLTLRTSPYQFALLDLKEIAADKKDNKFQFKKQSAVQHELRFVHFKLKNFGGEPDKPKIFSNQDQKFYRTNFSDAKADPLDHDSFYLSHRGLNQWRL